MSEPDIDKLLTRQAHALLERLEKSLPPDTRALFWFYNGVGQDLDLICAGINGHDEGDTYKLLKYMERHIQRTASGNERWFDRPDTQSTPSDSVVTSAAVTTFGRHEQVRIWNRGALAGELMVESGDGQRIAESLGLVERA